MLLFMCYTNMLAAEADETTSHENNAKFCKSSDGSEVITLDDMDKVNQGVIYMERYDNQTAPRNCTVKIRGNQTGVIFFKQIWRDATSGPCLKDRVVSGKSQHGSCPEQREYFDKEITITLETGNMTQAGFTIDFTVYPAFTMSEHIQHIDARTQPEGYITDHLFSEASKKRPNTVRAKIDNLPVTATITFQIEAVKEDTSEKPLFLIYYKKPHSPGNSNPYYIHYGDVTVRNQDLKFIGHYPLNIDYQKKFEAHYGESLRIKYKVKWCSGEQTINNLETLEQTQTNSSEYAAICKPGYELHPKETFYACYNEEEWLQPPRCRKIRNKTSETATYDTLSDHGDQRHTTVQPSVQKSMEVTEDLQYKTLTPEITIFAAVFGALSILATALGGIHRHFKMRTRRRSMSQKTTRPLPPLPTVAAGQLNVIDTKHTGNLDCESAMTPVYENIEKTDVYADYSIIDENDMLSSSQQNTTIAPSNAILPSTMITRCPSPGLLGSCLNEMEKRGMRLHDTFVQMPEHLVEKLSAASMVSPSPQLPCTGLSTSRPNDSMRLHRSRLIGESSSITTTQSAVALGRTEEIEIENEPDASPSGQNACEGATTNTEANEASLSHACTTHLNNDNRGPIQYEDALSVYDVYTLD